MYRTIAIVSILLGSLVTAPPASARLRLDFAGGAAILTEDIEIRGDHLDVDAGGAYAIGLGYSLTDWLELGGQFQHSLSVGILDDSFNVVSATAGGRVYLPELGPIRPWGALQLGWYNVDAEIEVCFLFCSDEETLERHGNGFGFNLGGGFDVFVNEWVSVGFDARYHHAVDVLGGVGFVTTMVDVALHFGEDARK